jgi:hypothetical protein
METVTFLGKQKSAKNFIDPHDCCIPKELTILSIGGDSSTPLYAVLYLQKYPPMICLFGLLLGHLKKNQFCVFMVKIQQPCTIYQNKTMVDDLRH